MAGAEAWHDLFIERRVPFQLGTYFYLRKRKDKSAILGDWGHIKKNWRSMGYTVEPRIFLDSGAFTFQENPDAAKKEGLDAEAYFQEYLKFVTAHHGVFDIIAEFDVGIDPVKGVQVPLSTIKKWRTQLYNVVGKKLLLCWHVRWGDSEFEDMCKDPRWLWLAISSEVMGGQKGKSLGMATRYISRAHRAGKVIHGFGQTRIQTDLKFMKYDSIDSTSWLRGDKFGASATGEAKVLLSEAAGISYESLESLFARMKTEQVENAHNALKARIDGSVYTDVGWKRTTGIVCKEIADPLFKVTLETGRQLTVTGDHNFFTRNREGVLVETAAKRGEYVVIPRIQWSPAKDDLHSLEVQIPKRHLTGRAGGQRWEETTETVLLTPALLYGIGSFLSDGAFVDGKGKARRYHAAVSIASYEEGCAGMLEAWAEEWGCVLTQGRHPVEVRLQSTRLADTLKGLGLRNGARKKDLPKWTWNLSEPQLKWMLAGLFDGDGSVDSKCYTLTSTSPGMRQQVLDLFSLLTGAPEDVRTTTNRVMLYDEAARYFETLPLQHSQKWKTRPAEGTFEKMLGRTPVALAHTLPPRAEGVGTTRAERVFAGSSYFHPTLCDEKYLFLKIRSVEELPPDVRLVYDLEVPETQRYLLNGVLSHNTFIYQAGKMTVINTGGDKGERARQRRLHKRYFEKLGLDSAAIINDEVKEVRKSSVMAWRMLSERHYTMGKMRGLDKLWDKYQLPREEAKTMESDSKKVIPRLKISLSKNGPKIVPPPALVLDPELDEDLNPPDGHDHMAPPPPKERGNTIYETMRKQLLGEDETTASTQGTFDRRCAHCGGEEPELEGKGQYAHAKCFLEHGGFAEQPFSGTLPIGPNKLGGGESNLVPIPLAIQGTPTMGDRETVETSNRGSSPDLPSGRFPDGSVESLGIQAVVPTEVPRNVPFKPSKRSLQVQQAINLLPKMGCNTCTMAQDCHEFQEGAVCAFLPITEGLSSRDPDNLLPLMESLVDIDTQRTFQAVLQERITAGGQIDPRTSNQIDRLYARLEGLQRMREVRTSTIKNSTLTVQTSNLGTTVQAEGPGHQSVLARLFGAPSTETFTAEEGDEQEVIEVASTPIDQGATLVKHHAGVPITPPPPTQEEKG